MFHEVISILTGNSSQVSLAIIGIIGTLLGAVVGGLLAPYFSLKLEKLKERDKILFDIYMQLLELHSSYFWVTVAEIHRKEPLEPVHPRINKLAWLIADDLRLIGDQKIVQRILHILMSDNIERYPSASKRYNELTNIVDELGNKLNPRYQKVTRNIGEVNMKARTKNNFRPVDKEGRIVLNAPASINDSTFKWLIDPDKP